MKCENLKKLGRVLLGHGFLVLESRAENQDMNLNSIKFAKDEDSLVFGAEYKKGLGYIVALEYEHSRETGSSARYKDRMMLSEFYTIEQINEFYNVKNYLWAGNFNLTRISDYESEMVYMEIENNNGDENG